MGTRGAIFTLISRDERFDAVFTASDFLRKQLTLIRVARAERKERNVQPNLADIERTHELHVRTTFRPYVQVAFEYTQVLPTGDGGTNLGPSGGTVQFALPTYGHFTSDIALRVRIAEVGTKTPTLAAPSVSSPSPMYRYTSYPGIRILSKVELRSDETLIDDYTADDVVAWSNTFLRDDLKPGWDRSMGQQEPKQASFFNNNGFSGIMQYMDGAQTPKFYQPPLDMWIPLQFWFCGNNDQAILNDLLAATQRSIKMQIAPLGQMLQALDQTTLAPLTLPISKLGVEMSLHVNNLYINPEVYDIFASRMGFSLIRVHRRQIVRIQAAAGRVLLDQLKYPAEFLFVGMRDPANTLSFEHWALMGKARVRTDATALLTPAAIWNSTLGVSQLVVRTATEDSTLDPIMDTLGLTVQGVNIYDPRPLSFYVSYLPMRYMLKSLTVTGADTSAAFLPLCLTAGQFQPSGYLNLSTTRETYVTYTAPDVTPLAPAELVISMSALNFIIRHGDAVRLRFAL
jgi:hypothetical protein